MSLRDLHSVFLQTKQACLDVGTRKEYVLSKKFKDAYSELVKTKPSFSRHDKATWLSNDTLSLHSRKNDTTTYIPAIFFFIAKELVPLYRELCLYRESLIEILKPYGKTLDDVDEHSCVLYIQKDKKFAQIEKVYLCKFVTDGSWWGKGRQIKRAQDFYESPLMQSSGLTQETQSEVARIAKQMADNGGLIAAFAMEVDLQAEFIAWAKRNGRSEKGISDAIPYLLSLTNPIAKPAQTIWHGLREALYGTKARCDVFHVDGLSDFDAQFGELERIFAISYEPSMKDLPGYKVCFDWYHATRADGKRVSQYLGGVYNLYRQFLKWREGQKNDELSPGTSVPEDRLSVAMRLFRESRKDDWLESGRAVNEREREFFSSYTDSKIDELDAAGVKELFCHYDGEGDKRFESMWSGKPGQGWPNIDPTGDEKKLDAVKKYLARLKADASVGATYWTEGAENRPKGFGPSVVTELLMKFHPEQCIKHGKVSREALEFLKLVDFTGEYQSNYSEEEYRLVTGAATAILGKMRTMRLPRLVRDDGSEDGSAPDYLTVNEFLWWARENKDLIKEEMMNKNLKKVNSKDRVKKGERQLKDAFNDDMMKRLAAALRTKPFAILAGHSGTGKSQLVRRLAYMTCNNQDLLDEAAGKTAPGNYCMVQVKPNWHDSTDLLGYYTDLGGRHFVNTQFVQFLCKAYAYPETPFFLCLDEMNLAPVEQYFAEYLSAIESLEPKGDVWLSDSLVEVETTNEKDENGNSKPDSEIIGQIMQGAQSQEAFNWIKAHGVTIPKNLFVVGTVNMDETTCQFSRKVLDRAMTLLMNKVEFGTMRSSKSPDKEELLDSSGIEFFLKGGRTGSVGDEEAKALAKVNEALANTPFVIAYRFANEYALYEDALQKLDGAATLQTALDDVVLMKLLPRIHGMKDVVEGIFNGRKAKKTGELDIPGLKEAVPAGGKSANMMDQILKRSDDYLTFWP